jgi:hypothetical protein
MGGGTATGGGAGTGGGAATGGGGGGGGGGGACTESWLCEAWQAVVPRDGGAGRACIDVNGCGTTTTQPALTAALPPLNFPAYQCQVQPVLAKSCAMAGCHGTLDPATRPFQVLARARQRNEEIIMYDRAQAGCLQTGTVAININEVGTGTASCNAKARLSANEWAINFDSARALAIGVANPETSELLTQPLVGSSFAHAGIKLWHTASADYAVVRQWLDGGTAVATCNNTTNN